MNAARRLFFCLSLVAGPVACSGSDGEGDAGPTPSACGTAGEVTASECAGLDECGAGAQNFTGDPTCDNCPGRADSHVCEAGACRALGQLELVNVLLAGDDAVGAAAFTIASLNPTMADGAEVSCAQLLSASCGLLDNPALNFVNSTHKRFAGGSAQGGMVYQTGISAEAGENRLILVQATSEQSGDGTVVAQGCVEGVTVPLPAGERLGVTLTAP